MTKILIIEDEQQALEALGKALRKNYEVELAASGEEGITILSKETIDVILLDIKMPGISGLEVLDILAKSPPFPPVILMTAHGDVPTAVEAMKKGAFNFLQKPLDLEHLRICVRQALDHSDLSRENRRLKAELGEKYRFENLIGGTPPMQQLFQMVAQVAPTSATILVTGENGTGKELVANALHQHSKRKDKPFIKLHCAALSEMLLESELFGHVRGAFTGAERDRKGFFEEAAGGTLFLDEIGEINQSTQVKLLRFLQDREFSPVGSSRTVTVDVRLIAATNRDLEKMIAEGKFREDLYYRLNVVNLRMPPLRERIDDIPYLVDHFLDKYAKRNNRTMRGVTPEFLETLCGFSWPGNVRQLENVMERAVILSPTEILDIDSLPPNISKIASAPTSSTVLPRGLSLRDMEKILIQRTLREKNGNKTKAAQSLGIGTKTLYRKLEEYELKEETQEPPATS